MTAAAEDGHDDSRTSQRSAGASSRVRVAAAMLVSRALPGTAWAQTWEGDCGVIPSRRSNTSSIDDIRYILTGGAASAAMSAWRATTTPCPIWSVLENIDLFAVFVGDLNRLQMLVKYNF